MASAHGPNKAHGGGKPPADPASVETALRMRDEGRWSVEEILMATGLSRATYFRYVKRRAEELAAREEPQRFVEEPALAPAACVSAPVRGSRKSCAQPDWERFDEISGDRRLNRRAFAYDEYLAACASSGLRPYSFASFCQGLSAWRRDRASEGDAEWLPGECMTTYWSHIGERRVFVAQLAFGDATFVCRSEAANAGAWMRCCERAFLFLGGVPHVTDCSMLSATYSGLSESVRSTLQGFAEHYRTVLYGARPKTASTAGRSAKPLGPKNSSAVLRSLRAGIGAMGEIDDAEFDAAVSSLLGSLNRDRSGDGPSRWDVLSERELPQMLRLPEERYDMAVWDVRHVGANHHFTLAGVAYSVPFQLAGSKVRIRYTDTTVRAYSSGEMVAEHRLRPEMRGRCVTDDSHRPNRHRWFARRLDERFLALAREHGPKTAKVMRAVLARCRAEGGGYRACKELLDLARQPSAVTLEEACSVCIANGAFGIAEVRASMGGAG